MFRLLQGISLTGAMAITAVLSKLAKSQKQLQCPSERKLNESEMVFYAIINKKEVNIYAIGFQIMLYSDRVQD